MSPLIEHIVYDGGSTDKTLEILKKYKHLSWISEKDEGHYHAMHKGVIASKGKYFSILNGDDCFTNGSLKAISDALLENPNWDGLFGDVRYIDQNGTELFKREEACYDYDVLRYDIGYIIHPTFFLSKEMYKELGGFRYKLFKNCADIDLIVRCGAAKAKIGHINRIIINYRFHQFGQSADSRIQNNTKREYAQIQAEHGKASGYLGMIQKIVFKAKRQFQKLIFRGKLDIIPGGFFIKKITKEKCVFSSNLGLDNLPENTKK